MRQRVEEEVDAGGVRAAGAVDEKPPAPIAPQVDLERPEGDRELVDAARIGGQQRERRRGGIRGPGQMAIRVPEAQQEQREEQREEG